MLQDSYPGRSGAGARQSFTRIGVVLRAGLRFCHEHAGTPVRVRKRLLVPVRSQHTGI